MADDFPSEWNDAVLAGKLRLKIFGRPCWVFCLKRKGRPLSCRCERGATAPRARRLSRREASHADLLLGDAHLRCARETPSCSPRPSGAGPALTIRFVSAALRLDGSLSGAYRARLGPTCHARSRRQQVNWEREPL